MRKRDGLSLQRARCGWTNNGYGTGVTKISNIDHIVHNAEWLAHRYDPGHDSVHFLHVPREERIRATFLTDEYLENTGAPVVIRRSDARSLAPEPAPLHFVFHSAFCLSTLLARAFELPGVATSLKEPPILNDIVGWRYREAPEGKRVAEVLDHSLRLLARSFAPGEAVVLKPSNVVVGLTDAMIAMRPRSRVLLLHAPLPIYLRSIAKKGVDGRLWVRDLLAKLLRERLIDMGLEGEDYLRLTDLQAAAVGWLAQQALFARLVTRYPDRVRTLNSETIMAKPAETIGALAGHFGLGIDPQTVKTIVEGPAFNSHSKHGKQFGAAARDAEYRAAAEAHADEIAKVEIWAATVAGTAGIEMELGQPLLAKANAGA
ncbi:MAG: hypothetical protein ABI898_01510 [Sphingomonadales bacterium]